ncbi:hypothetical protein MNBD_GAMMA21-2865 [hydrothermal vent metagenome]|uniref:J domain-containing protein n=1 Tax=hydrothermal vent metagenome TaxID=652676 RepID=A0A3B1ALC8_9ZZZZ
MNLKYPAPETLYEPIQQVLADHPSGLSEYEFLAALGQNLSYFARCSPDSLILFQRHFLLFHCLYRLQHDYYESKTGILQISALHIRLWPYQTVSDDIQPLDSVREYYLDISSLDSTDAAQVDDLLGKFWLALARHDSRHDALALLELADPVDDQSIRKRYRERVMLHHPDRGGDQETIKQLNLALAKLLPK